MIKKQRLLGFIEAEIHFHGDPKYPAWKRFFFWVFRLRPCNETVVNELDFLQEMINAGIFEWSPDRKNLLEALSWYEHLQWMDWSKSLAESECLSSNRMKRWQGLWIPYNELTEEQKDQDRIRAREIMAIVKDFYREGDEE
jgi:hypothetical protein